MVRGCPFDWGHLSRPFGRLLPGGAKYLNKEQKKVCETKYHLYYYSFFQQKFVGSNWGDS